MIDDAGSHCKMRLLLHLAVNWALGSYEMDIMLA